MIRIEIREDEEVRKKLRRIAKEGLDLERKEREALEAQYLTS